MSLISFACGYLIFSTKDSQSAGASSLPHPTSEPITLKSNDSDVRGTQLGAEKETKLKSIDLNQFTFADPELKAVLDPLREDLSSIQDFSISEVGSLADRIEEYPTAGLMMEALGQISVDNGFADKLIFAAGEKVIGFEVLVPSIARKSVLNGCVEAVKRNIDLQKDEYLKAAYYSEVANLMLQRHLAGIHDDGEVPSEVRPYYDTLISQLPPNTL